MKKKIINKMLVKVTESVKKIHYYLHKELLDKNEMKRILGLESCLGKKATQV